MAFETVVSGVYLEGLCADATSVWVADPIKGGVRRCHSDGTIQAWMPEKLWVGSLLRGPDEIVLVSGEGGIAWLDDGTGKSGMLLDTVNGVPLPGVNEMITDKSGAVYFGFETKAIVRMRPDGTLIDPFAFPGGGATNVPFGGEDRRTLYITSVAEGASMKLAAGIWPTVEDSILYRGRSDVPGPDLQRAAMRPTTA